MCCVEALHQLLHLDFVLVLLSAAWCSYAPSSAACVKKVQLRVYTNADKAQGSWPDLVLDQRGGLPWVLQQCRQNLRGSLSGV